MLLETAEAPSIMELAREALTGRHVDELVGIEEELQRRRWMTDPNVWAEERAKLFLWSRQKEILHSLAKNRKTAAPGCHGWGKSYDAAVAICYWIDAHPLGEAIAVTTAPTAAQVKTILWKEVRKMHSDASLPGRTNLTEWYVTVDGKYEQLVALGRKPSDYSPTAFQGIHAHFVLVVFDEAGTIRGETEESPHSLWVSAESLMTNEDCRALALGNPDLPDSEFAEICKPGSGWNTIHTSVFETPNLTGEPVPEDVRVKLVSKTWVEDRRQKWAPDWYWNAEGTMVLPPKGETLETALEKAHPLWVSKVFGRFPKTSEARTLIPTEWIVRAQRINLDPSGPNELGVDVGAGGDSSTIAHRRGGVVRIIHEDHNPDTMVTLGHVIQNFRKVKASRAKIDYIGVGQGVVDRGKEQGFPFVGIKTSESAEDVKQFANYRAELWWSIRTLFERGEIDLDPTDTRTAKEFASIKYFPNSSGQIQIESKEKAKARGVGSPNRAEAILMSFAEETGPQGGVLW